MNSEYTKREISRVGVQTVSAIQGNLKIMFENVTQFSNLIYFDDGIQNALRKIDSKAINVQSQKQITKSLVNMILSGDYISGAFIVDQYCNYYSSYKKAPKKVHMEDVYDTNWYRNLNEKKGNGFFIHGSEGVIDFYGEQDYITYIRQIRDKNTYDDLATLMITVNSETIQKYFDEVSDTYSSEFFIVDKSGNFIIEPPKDKTELKEYLRNHKLKENVYDNITLHGKKMVMINQDMGMQDWTLVGCFESDNAKALVPYYSVMLLVEIATVIGVILLLSFLLSRLIFRPLEKMEKHMKMVENGEFVEMTIDHQEHEINNLKKVFNHMIRSIQSLISQVKEEEQIIVKGELDLVQAQINPHFLYNTLDAVSALALMKDYDNCFKMTQALGSFYRNSLNSGMDFISIRDEVDCIKSYITILNIRYDNKIHIEFEVEEKLYSEKILKLLLQPLVENAVHHGFNTSPHSGNIVIRIFEDEDEIILLVSDDGIGMSEEQIEKVLNGENLTGKSGFGIYSLIQRIQIYYHIDTPLMIHSEIDNGTEIAVRIKKMLEV